MKIAAIILAAGLSTRMKTNKLQLDLQGMTLIDRVLLKVSAVDFFEKIIVTNDPLIEERSKALKFIPVANELTALGQSSSIKEGVLHASREVEGPAPAFQRDPGTYPALFQGIPILHHPACLWRKTRKPCAVSFIA